MKAKNRHILILTPGYPKDEGDTSCIPALQLFVRNLAKTDSVKVSVISVHYPFVRSNYSWYNCEVSSLGIPNKKRNRLLSFYKQWKALKNIHRNHPIDCIHSFWLGECTLIGYYFSKVNNIAHLATFMGQDAKKGNRFAPFLPLKKMKLISLSSFHQREISANYRITAEIIPWGVDDTYIIKAEEKVIDIIGIGSLIELKNYSEFIQTIHLLKRSKPTIRVVLIGDGPLKEILMHQIKMLQLEDNIELKGNITYHETQQYLAKSRVLLHPSEFESFGMVFAEAIAHKTSVVSRKVGFFANDKHWSIGNNPQQFAEYCLQLLDSKDNWTIPYPNIENTLSSYLKIYFGDEESH